VLEGTRKPTTGRLIDYPSECLHGDCTAPPDLDSPVALCQDHGMAVFASYLGRLPERVASVRPVETQRSRTGWVYFFRRGEMVKIGWSGNVERRADTLHADAVLHAQPGTMQDERRLHAAFQHLRIESMGREWFRAERDLLSFIYRLKTEAA
jgi:hypothetical protein